MSLNDYFYIEKHFLLVIHFQILFFDKLYVVIIYNIKQKYKKDLNQ